MTKNAKGAVERRTSERHFFSESGEVLDVGSGTRLKVRVADISLEGCYMDTMNPFPAGTLVRVTINRNGAGFISTGTVRNSQHGMGMGITFAELGAMDKALLSQWISELSSPSSPATKANVVAPVEPASSPEEIPEDQLTRRLIELLRKKGQLTEGEVALLLRDTREDDLIRF